jgi:hypothetical protein
VRGVDDAILTGTHAGRIAALSDYALGEAACHDVVVVPWRRRSSSNSATCRRPDVVRSTAGSSARACLLQHLTHLYITNPRSKLGHQIAPRHPLAC